MAIRPAGERAEEIAALPYDVYNRKEAKAVVEKAPLSFLRIDRGETNFPDDVDTYDDRVYAKAKEILWDMVDKGYFVQDTEKYYYIYELTMEGRTQTGIVACAAVSDYENGVIKKHENTRAEKEVDRIRHVDTLGAQTGPIFLAYRNNEKIDSIVNKTKQQEALYDFVSEDGIRHRVFIIFDPEDIKTIEASFDGISDIYIADGHHRCASAVKVGQKRRQENPNHTGEEEYNFFLSVLFPQQELKIMDYNRVVKDLNGMGADEFFKKLSDVATVLEESKEPVAPEKKGEFSLYLKENWYRMAFKDEMLSDDPVDGLDVAILQNQVLYPMLDIEDPKTSPRIDFVGGIRGPKELEKRCHEDCVVAFWMYPTDIAELFAVADAGRLMPPKSTWFEPKLRSGLFIHDIRG